MQKYIIVLLALITILTSIPFVASPHATVFANSSDQCNQVTQYERTSDLSDSRVSIDFSSNRRSISVSAQSGYTIVNIWLDVDNDGQGRYVNYGSNSMNNFNPSGDEINEVKVQVKKVCVTPTPTNTQVKICHATGSNSNPYTTQTVNDDAVNGNGNGNSDHNRSDHQNGEDIIPPGTWDADGRNWTTQNQAIWNNNCTIPTVTPTVPTTPTVTITPTMTITPTDTPTPTPTTGTGSIQGSTVTPTATPSATLTPTDTPTPTPTSGQTNSSSPSSSTSSTSTSNEPVRTVESIQATMGTSTMANTGTFITTFMNSLFLLGSFITSMGLLSHRTDKKEKK